MMTALTLNPFALDGAHFLLLYALLLAASLALGRLSAARLRPEGRRQTVSDPDALALLGGGPERVAETALTRLLVAGQLRHDGKRLVRGSARWLGRGALDQALLTLPMPLDWRDVSRATRRETQRLCRQLEAQGLLMEAEARARLRLAQALPLLLLLGLGALRLWQGLAHGKPVGFLIVLMALALALLLIALVVDPRTRAGIAAWQEARAAHRRLQLAAPDDEAALGVALFGTAVLAGSWLEPLHRKRSGDGEGGVEAGGDAGGGCGGGCGGCGS